MAKKQVKHKLEGSRCVLCNGTGVVFSDLDDVISKKIELYDKKKIPRTEITKSIYQYLFIKYGFTPTIGEASTFFNIMSLDVYTNVFLPKIQKVAIQYIKDISNYKRNHEKRKMLIWESDNGTIKPESLDKLLEAQNYKCNLCQKNIVPRGDRHLDHIIPISKGGKHILDNVQWLCVSCNVKKYNKLNFSIKNDKKDKKDKK